MSGKTSNSLAKYCGKRFFDAGTSNEEADAHGEEPFQPGDFIVKQFKLPENNFNCLRVGEVDSRDNYVPFDIGYTIRRIREYEEE